MTAMIAFGFDGKVKQANPAAERLLAFPTGKLVGITLSQLIHSSKLHSWECVSVPLIAQGHDGSKIPVDMMVAGIDSDQWIVLLVRNDGRRPYLEQEIFKALAGERNRLGLEIHDAVGQELTGLGLMADTLAHDLGEPLSQFRALAVRLSDGVRQVLRHCRNLSSILLDDDIGATALPAALTGLVTSVRESAGLQCTFEQTGAVCLRDGLIATHLFRIAQEATTNTIRHARASSIVVALSTTENNIILRVQDDGIGLPPNLEASEGLGFKSMRFRARVIGGALRIESGSDGTVIVCEVPLKTHTHRPDRQPA
jgi:signal transduction histidine kinase